MTAQWLAEDEPFFREWYQRTPGECRDLQRAAGLFEIIRPASPLPPILAVLGSKGKGTAVTFASATLAACGLRVGSVSSPPFRTNRERIRINGQQLSHTEYLQMSARLATALEQLPPSQHGYLSPTGAFTVAGVAWLVASGVDVLVLEEGLGGSSDEISLFPAEVIAFTEIFEEHLGVLGATVRDVAEDLAGVIHGAVRHVCSVPQRSSVNQILRCRAPHGVSTVTEDTATSWIREAIRNVRGLSRQNATLGIVAALALAESLGHDLSSDRADRLFRSVQLPGRLSRHEEPHGCYRIWVVDAAINPAGVEAALSVCRAADENPSLVLGSFPDSKDAAACYQALTGYPLIPVKAGESYLNFSPAAAPAPYRTLTEALTLIVPSDNRILAIGTMSFVGDVLNYLRVPVDNWWY